MSSRVVTFGEVMGRIAPAQHQLFTQTLPGAVEFTFGGGEANVAVSLALFGQYTTFVTALPNNPIADACLYRLRGLGVDTTQIVRGTGRLGLYYLETGANQRASNVVYDRDYSSLMLTPAQAYNWSTIFKDAAWFHVTGITPALCANTAEATIAAVSAAKAAGLTVSCDLNFRKKLWNWRPGTKPRELAEETMRQVLPFVDVVIANEEDAEKVLGIKASGTDVDSGALEIAAYRDVAARIIAQFPNIARVAITLRESHSADHNNWGGMLYEAQTQQAYFAPINALGVYTPYEIRDIVDRVGGGDSFGAGLIFASLTEGLNDAESTIRFAVAASCLKHAIHGDFNYATREEVLSLMGGAATGRVNR